MKTRSNVSRFSVGNLKEYGLLAVFVVIIVLFQVLTHGKLLSAGNPNNIIGQNAQVVILAIGMLMVIIAGHIDLSVGSVVAVVGALIGLSIDAWGFHWLLAIPFALIVGAIIGAWQGFWVAYVKVPAFIVTLAGMLVFRGANILLLSDGTIAGLPGGYQDISSGHVPGLLGTLPTMYISIPGLSTFSIGDVDILTMVLGVIAAAGYVFSQVRARAKQRARDLPTESLILFLIKAILLSAGMVYFSYLLADYKGTPYVLLLLAGLVFLASFVLNRTVFGRHIYAIGGNRFAAVMSGVKTRKVDFFIFVNMGVLSALTAVVATARSASASTELGDMYELDAIAAVFVGGAAVQGGVGKVSGAVLGALVMGVLNMGLVITQVDSAWVPVIKGFVLLGAVIFDIITRRRSGSV